MECSICYGLIEPHRDQKGKIYWDQGHNAQPVNDGRCCDTCNETVVIRARINQFTKSRRDENETAGKTQDAKPNVSTHGTS